jgi:hypothetical protein
VETKEAPPLLRVDPTYVILFAAVSSAIDVKVNGRDSKKIERGFSWFLPSSRFSFVLSDMIVI